MTVSAGAREPAPPKGRGQQHAHRQARAHREPVLGCSVGIMAYNEEANIANAIDSILGQTVHRGRIDELIVVASGCTDATASIVADLALTEPRLRLVVQEHREGKASAINLFIDRARSPVLLMVGADVQVRDGSFDAMLRHFDDPQTGMVGGHPIPVNDERTFLGHAVHLLWRLHDRLARDAPKLGEIVAFRNVVPSIPLDSPVDEISIQALVTQLGYQLVYEPQAVVYNRGPANIQDFLRQRRRIYAGHLRIRRQQGYTASTMSVKRITRALLGSGSFATPRAALWTLCAIALEVAARLLGHLDHVRHQPHHVWKTVSTTKRHIAEGANQQALQNVLVFHIVDFHRQQLELGIHAGRQLTQQVMRHIEQGLTSSDLVSVQRAGTIIAVVSGDREEAQRAAGEVVQSVQATPVVFNGHRDGVTVRLVCGIIAFSWTEQMLAAAIPGPAKDAAKTGRYKRTDAGLEDALAEAI